MSGAAESSARLPWPRLGCGMGLRREHYDVVLTERPPVEWFEVVTENYLDTGGRPLAVLEAVRRESGLPVLTVTSRHPVHDLGST